MMSKIITALILILLVGWSKAEWVPSGERECYDSTTKLYRKATGGPPWNFQTDDDNWYKINPDFYLDNGWLKSDSGRHKVYAQLSTNTVWMEWSGHWLGLKIGPLFALRYSTKDTTRLANPDFSTRSYSATIASGARSC